MALKKKQQNEDLDPISRLLSEASELRSVDTQWPISSIPVGARVEFKIQGVDNAFVKLSGECMGVVDDAVVFSSLEGVFNVKHKFHPRTPIVVICGNRAYLTIISSLKSQQLKLVPITLKAIKIAELRKDPRFTCHIPMLLQVEKRGVTQFKSIHVENLSLRGCCISIQQGKDDRAMGLFVGKRIVLSAELKLKQKRIELPAIVRNIRKDLNDNFKKLIGIEFVDLSQEGVDTIGGLTGKLKLLSDQQKQPKTG